MIQKRHSQKRRVSPFPGIRRGTEKSAERTLIREKDESEETISPAMSPDPIGDLGDCNEQESEKMGFMGWERDRISRETDSQQKNIPKRVVSNVPTVPEPGRVVWEEHKKKEVAESPEERKEVIRKIPPSEPYTPPPLHREEKKGRGIGKLCVGILTATLLLASLTLFVSVLASRASEGEWQGEGTAKDEVPADVPVNDSPDKIIFVKQYDDQSGILTTAELYARCADSVVSILAQGEKNSGVGSGFFITSDGYIATANHVVEGMESLTVVEADGSRHRATLVAGNALTDLALLKIEKEGCSEVDFASSADLLVGEKVVAIGTPAALDYAGSVCTGELSFVGRSVKIYGDDGQIQKKMTLLQTDAPLNPGNSGCPLFNEYGQVVGIVTMKLGSSYVGMGFAIPSSGAMKILSAMMRGEVLTEELLSEVSTVAPSLGILGEAQTEEGVCGVRVLDFSSATAPVSYILKKGDLIVQIDGTPVANRSDVTSVIQQKTPGDMVAVTVLRGGQWLTFRLALMSSATELT